MAKHYCLGILMLSLLVSCTKSQDVVPEKELEVYSSFIDKHIAVVDVKLIQSSASEVSFNFSTRYEKDITMIEVYQGETPNTLCSFFTRNVAADSHDIKNYKAVDVHAGKNSNYYMIKYTTTNGDWSYSQLYPIKMK